MRRRFGSWPWLVLALGAFLLAFAWLRSASSFLRIEAELADARLVAAQAQLAVADALALRDLIGVEAAPERWRQAALRLAELRAEFGVGLAAVALAGDGAAVRAALAAHGGDAAAAWQAFRSSPAAVPGLRFLALRERFAARLPQADRDD